MSRIGLLLLAVLLAGCQQWDQFRDSLASTESENSVLGAPPPRYRMPDQTDRRSLASVPSREESASVLPVSLTGGIDDHNGALFGSQTVAVVNGTPVLASDVLERWSTQLAQAREQASPEEFDQLRLELIRRDLNAHIERTLLAQALRSTIPPDRVATLNEFMDKMFQEEVDRLKSEAGVSTAAELEEVLQKDNTSLAALKSLFVTQRMAMEYLASKSKVEVRIGRRELLDYYEAHKDQEYFLPGRARWQQIQLSYARHGGQSEASRALRQVLDELERGADFGDVARRYSDGPRAGEGGHWDWTQRGSLADTQIEEVLFALPVGRIGQPLEGERAYHVVKVTARTEDRHQPFEEVQAEIRTKLETQARRAAAGKVIEELQKDAVVMTIFDHERTAETP
jgi:parvulin-like peptidyl-prolyl isomerase